MHLAQLKESYVTSGWAGIAVQIQHTGEGFSLPAFSDTGNPAVKKHYWIIVNVVCVQNNYKYLIVNYWFSTLKVLHATPLKPKSRNLNKKLTYLENLNLWNYFFQTQTR